MKYYTNISELKEAAQIANRRSFGRALNGIRLLANAAESMIKEDGLTNLIHAKARGKVFGDYIVIQRDDGDCLLYFKERVTK